MSSEKRLKVRFIGIDIIPDGAPFVELKIDLHIFDVESQITKQIVGNYGRIYKRISEMQSIPAGNVADDGVIDNIELMELVAHAALSWVADFYGTMINEDGRVVIP